MFKPANADEWLQIYYEAELEKASPGVVGKARLAAARGHDSELALHEALCLLLDPDPQYILTALERVAPHDIVECGVGTSTAVFLRYCEWQDGAQLWSCDSNPPGPTGTIFAAWEGAIWHFYQIDPIEFLRSGLIPHYPSIIFLDAGHSYDHTMEQLAVARCMTDAILLDDVGYPCILHSVKHPVTDFLERQSGWERADIDDANGALLVRSEE